MSFGIGAGLSTADGSAQHEWASSNLLKAQTEQEGRRSLDSLSRPDYMSWSTDLLPATLLILRPSDLAWNPLYQLSSTQAPNYTPAFPGPPACRWQTAGHHYHMIQSL